MKLVNLITYQEYITKNKGYKKMGQRHYFNYCSSMHEYASRIYTNSTRYNDIEDNTKMAEEFYRINVCPNFGR